MKYQYEDHRAFFFINRLLDFISLENNDIQSDLVYWANRYKICPKKSKSEKKAFEDCLKTLQTLAQTPPKMSKSPAMRNLDFIVKTFHLSCEEKDILEAAFLWKNNFIMKKFIRSSICRSSDISLDYAASLANTSQDKMRVLLSSNQPLQKYSLLSRNRFDGEYTLENFLCDYLNSDCKNNQERKDFLLGKNCNADWLAQDLKYIPETDFAVRLMKQAHLENGFNILLYGAPGTGKTCFAQMLAKETQNALFSVGEYSKGEMQINHRLQALYFKEVILSQQPNACLLFDEAEDLFSSNLTKCNKVEINRLLENNSLPIIWITNKIHLMDPAFIRRFTLAIHFKKPPVQIQQKIWQKHLQQNQLPHSKSQALALAKEYSVPPSMIAGAVKAARLVNGDIKVVKNHLEIMTQALNFGRIKAKTAPQTETFNPALINADADLCTMTEQLQKLERLNFSLCLYGAPGTGKSAYGRYLADKLGLRVIQKRASDLLGCYVGETEENIAKAFAQAKENKSMLIFDEADSFLQDRGRASHSWEVSSVNEMLTWMESHPYPFICTTNLITQLDPASLRRFSFKVKYGYLNPAQVQNAFQHFFNLQVPAQWAEELSSLTPGDFALVKNKAEILGALKDPEKLKQMLTDEQKLKETRGNSQIGFCANI